MATRALGKRNAVTRSFSGVDSFKLLVSPCIRPQEGNPKGEIHEDIGFISYDRGAKKFSLRQFHAEGCINEFKLESFDPKQRRFVCNYVHCKHPAGLAGQGNVSVLEPG